MICTLHYIYFCTAPYLCDGSVSAMIGIDKTDLEKKKKKKTFSLKCN